MPPRGRPSLYPQICDKCGDYLESRQKRFLHSNSCCSEQKMSVQKTESKKRKNDSYDVAKDFLEKNIGTLCRAYKREGRDGLEYQLGLYPELVSCRSEIHQICQEKIESCEATFKKEADSFAEKKALADEKRAWETQYSENLRRFKAMDDHGKFEVPTEKLEAIRDGLVAYLAGIETNLKRREVAVDMVVYDITKGFSFEEPKERVDTDTQLEDLF